MKITVVVLNLNLSRDTINVVADLKKQKLPAGWTLEIIVVDNGSSDNSVAVILAAHPDITLLPGQTNLGVAGGYNRGIRHALKHGTDFLIVSNNDLIIDQKDCLRILAETLLNNPSAGAAVPLIYFAKGFEYHENNYPKKDLGKVIWYAGGIIDRKNILMSHRGVDEIDCGRFSKTEPTDFATGAFVMFPRKVLEKVGLFNEKYFAYLEDAELSTRIVNAGYQLLFVPAAKISHKVSQTASGGIGGAANDYFITRNRLFYGMKYAPLRTKFALLREAVKFLFSGRPKQKEAVRDFFLSFAFF